MQYKKSKKNGFTLLEILIVISLIVIMVSIAVYSSHNFSRSINLENTTKEIGSKIQLAKSQSISSLYGTHYGIHLEPESVTLFAGDVYSSGAPTNQKYFFSNAIEIYNYNLSGGGNDIVFQRLIGSTNNFGTVYIRVIKNPTNVKQIIINSDGQISLDAFQTSVESPIQNARHIHFDLGWNINNVTTLRLEGINPQEINDIDATQYFNFDKSEFDWSGTINIDGIDQTMRIHSWLDGTTSILCIMREQNENDELKISFFEGTTEKHIATYKNNGGIISVIPGVFGGSFINL